MNISKQIRASKQVRQDFLDFFAEKGHKIVPSAPVIPFDDPTLLFTNAGMNQFKDVFLGTGKREYTRCADTQKCIRVSGKHNDLEEVGHDGYHHTFFEMLGNWSFGDYYKKEAIRWAWELLTGVWKLDKNRLWATVYNEDDESFNLWKTETDISHAHILKFDEKDNFWEMGETGPCGPCSEIHYDFSDKGCSAGDFNSGNPEVMEIWNLVFIQYNRDENGKLHDLPQKHVDTGMGFERMVRVLQNKKSNYETDVFLPLINELIQITGKEYSGKFEPAMNVVADHVRTLTFAIADGAIPSNEGRGYVLRRILRRAARYGRNLEMHKPFIYKLVEILVKTMGNVFPEISDKQKFIKDVVHGEEEGFNETLDRGIVFFNEEIEKMKKSGSSIFSGEVAFKLHDTYGFPVDLTQLMARELGFEVDVEKFEELMNEQKERARSARQIEKEYIKDFQSKTGSLVVEPIYNPYNIDEYGIQTEIISIIDRSPLLIHNLDSHSDYNNLGSDIIKDIYLKQNPFYSESGGQVSDIGILIASDIRGNKVELNVKASYKQCVTVNNFFTNIDVNRPVIAQVNYPRRLSIQRNHSATHLVHEALRRVLGSHVKQMGSYLDDKILRFDFQHFHKVSESEINEIEQIVNDKIKEDINTYAETMSIELANKIPNVKKFFGEKYESEVRVVFIDERYSVEFCGGTHVDSTRDIGFFKIFKEESVASGIRRIFAVTGEESKKYLEKNLRDGTNKFYNIKDEVKVIKNFNPSIIKSIDNDIIITENELDAYHNEIDTISPFDTQSLTSLSGSFDGTNYRILKIESFVNKEKKVIEKQKETQTLKAVFNEIDFHLGNNEFASQFEFPVFTLNYDGELESKNQLKEIGDYYKNKLPDGTSLSIFNVQGKLNLLCHVSSSLINRTSLTANNLVAEVAEQFGGKGGGRPLFATAGLKDNVNPDEIFKVYISKIQEKLKK